MATLAQVNAKLDAADVSTNNIAADVAGLKAKLDAAIVDTAGQVDTAVSAALQAVSDGLDPLVGKLQGVASSTPEDAPVPVQPQL